jgi:hypothetical protein
VNTGGLCAGSSRPRNPTAKSSKQKNVENESEIGNAMLGHVMDALVIFADHSEQERIWVRGQPGRGWSYADEADDFDMASDWLEANGLEAGVLTSEALSALRDFSVVFSAFADRVRFEYGRIEGTANTRMQALIIEAIAALRPPKKTDVVVTSDAELIALPDWSNVEDAASAAIRKMKAAGIGLEGGSWVNKGSHE